MLKALQFLICGMFANIIISEVRLWTAVVVEVWTRFSYIVIIGTATVMSVICSSSLYIYDKTIVWF